FPPNCAERDQFLQQKPKHHPRARSSDGDTRQEDGRSRAQNACARAHSTASVQTTHGPAERAKSSSNTGYQCAAVASLPRAKESNRAKSYQVETPAAETGHSRPTQE